MVLTGDFVNFRASYAGGGTVLACLRQGTVVKQLSSQTYNGGWYHVEYNGQKGYIWGQYLKSVSSSSANANTAKEAALANAIVFNFIFFTSFLYNKINFITIF